MADIAAGKNLVDLKKEIADKMHNIKQAKLDRADINAEIQAAREALAARGIPKKAFDMAMKYIDMDPEDREGFDIAYALCREAGGLPMQEDLFAAAERMAKEAETPADPGKPAEPDAGEIEKVIRAQDAEKVKGKTVHEPTGEHKGAIN